MVAAISFFFNDAATSEIYTLSLHDALPIFAAADDRPDRLRRPRLPGRDRRPLVLTKRAAGRSDRAGLAREGSAPSAPCRDRKSTRLNSSHANISYAVFCLQKKNPSIKRTPR